MKAIIFTAFFLECILRGLAQTPQSPLTVAEQRKLDVNQVEALILGRNNKHWDLLGTQAAYYRVPKNQTVSAGFANSIWIAGLDNANMLHTSANTYRQSGADFWPGPLDTVSAQAYTGAAYNKIWKVGCDDINQFVAAFNNGSVTANTYPVPADMQNYPAKGTGNFMRNMAPFHDANNDGQYNVMHGDYPKIRGHQQVLSIFNDNYSVHGETGGQPMGLEIHERSYAYNDPNLPDSMKAVNYSTYYHYTIFNRSSNFYHDVYLSCWSDVDLGSYTDDYVGSDSVAQIAYCYNGTPSDPGGYGSNVPVVSQTLIHTDCSSDGIDNNQNGIIDEQGETFKINKVTYYNNNVGVFNTAMINPTLAIQYYNYQKGIWLNGWPFVYGWNAFPPTATTTPLANYVYSGDPQTQTGWTEASVNNFPGDRRFIMTSGPFSFPPNSKIEWGYAVVFSRDTTVANTVSRFNTVVKRDVKNAVYYDKQNNQPQCQPSIVLGMQEKANDLKMSLYPNPGKDRITLLFNQNMDRASLKMTDVLGQVVKEKQMSGEYEATLSVHELPAGVYMINIEQKGKTSTVKWIKQE